MIFVLSFFVMLFIVGAMAVGAMAGREPLKGSCGGLSAVGIDGQCEICGKDPNSCDDSTDSESANGEMNPSVNSAIKARDTEFYDATK